MPLPTEVITTIADIIKRRPSSDVTAIVSEVIETLAGKDPNWLLSTFKAAGGPSEFVKAINDEIRRLKSIGS
jgi:hypothetical protein